MNKNMGFSSEHAPVALHGIVQKNIDEASKNNNFQKKFQKYLLVEEIGHFFKSNKARKIPQIGENVNGKSMKIDFKNFHFSLIYHWGISGVWHIFLKTNTDVFQLFVISLNCYSRVFTTE